MTLLTQVFVEQGSGIPDASAFDVLENAIQQGKVRYLMALQEGGHVIGVVSLTFGFSTVRMTPFAILGDLYVHPGHRGRGAAAQLLRSAMDAAHAEGCAYMITMTADGMEGIFERCRWQRGKTLIHFEIDPEGAPPSLTLTGDITFD